ncbi:hypothetical protein [Rhodococcus sp. NPDC003348]
MTTDMQAGRHADPSTPATDSGRVPDGPRAAVSAGTSGRSVAARVTVALALVGLVVCAILLVADFRTDGVNCGSPASPHAQGVIGADRFEACGEELDTRRALAWIGLGATGIVAALGCVASRSSRESTQAKPSSKP